jgi:5-(carboxyamino)imidazole ribonucleotide synthase
MRIGVVGGGQLGRMLGLAGIPLGFEFRFLDPSPDACAGAVGGRLVAAYDDEDALRELAEWADVATYEFENVPVRSAEVLEAAGAPVRPGVEALRVSQDRLDEKEFFHGLGIATAPFRAVDSREELAAAVDEIGLPAVLKTRRMGYDGKGQAVLRSPADLADAWEALGGRPLVLEGFVDFRRELSVIAARGTGGAIQVYPVVENTHEDGILRRSRAPALKVSDICRVGANRIARAVLERLDYVGVVAIELFETGDGLIANEMAPRVHNSGHWSIEGAETSQFENHLRAIAGLPLGSTRVSRPAGMVNILGTLPETADVLSLPGAHLHLYGKEERPGRKIGHVTVVDGDAEVVRQRLDRLLHPPADPADPAPA